MNVCTDRLEYLVNMRFSLTVKTKINLYCGNRLSRGGMVFTGFSNPQVCSQLKVLLWSHDSLPSIRWDGCCLQLFISFRAAAQHHMSTQSPYYTCWSALSSRSVKAPLTADEDREWRDCPWHVVWLCLWYPHCEMKWNLLIASDKHSYTFRRQNTSKNARCKLNNAKCDRKIAVRCCQCEPSYRH